MQTQLLATKPKVLWYNFAIEIVFFNNFRSNLFYINILLPYFCSSLTTFWSNTRRSSFGSWGKRLDDLLARNLPDCLTRNRRQPFADLHDFLWRICPGIFSIEHRPYASALYLEFIALPDQDTSGVSPRSQYICHIICRRLICGMVATAGSENGKHLQNLTWTNPLFHSSRSVNNLAPSLQ